VDNCERLILVVLNMNEMNMLLFRKLERKKAESNQSFATG